VTRPYRRRYLVTPTVEPLPTCVAAWTDDVGLERYRATLTELGWTWKSPQQLKENAT